MALQQARKSSENTRPTISLDSWFGASKTRIKYTSRKSEVDPEDVHALLVADAEGHPRDLEQIRRIMKAPSTIVIGAFAVEPMSASDDPTEGFEQRLARGGGSRWGWLRSIKVNKRHVQARLVGFARATSDLALVASVQEVRVAAEFQQIGVGKKLMHRIAKVIMKDDVYDIGLVTPDATVRFFEYVSPF